MGETQSQGAGRAGTLLFQGVLTTFFAIAGLYYGSGVLVPLSLAVLLFVLITALIDRFERAKVLGLQTPKWLAHVLAFGVVGFGLTIILAILSSQAGAVNEAFPRYEARFADLISRLAALIGDEAFEAAKRGVAEMNISSIASGAISSAGGFLSALFLVILYVAFLMAERAPMRSKLVLAITDDETYQKVIAIADSMSLGLQRYLGIKTFVSVLTAIGSYAFMKPVGLDFAETWAVLAFLLNFIPTIGSMIGVALPTVVALVQFESLSLILVVLIGCGAVQFVVGNIVEPSMTGRSLNLSPFLVILSLTFWTAIWGIPGALLSVPITVCTMIVMCHIPKTRSLAILMSGDGAVGEAVGPPQGNPASEETDTAPGKHSTQYPTPKKEGSN